jgi:uncharacterized membrane protein
MHYIRKIKGNTTSLLIITIFLLVFIIPFSTIATTNNYFGTTSNIAYGQPDQINSNNITDSINIQNIPAKKVHVEDIDIAYKILGKGDHILLISGSGNVMDV